MVQLEYWTTTQEGDKILFPWCWFCFEVGGWWRTIWFGLFYNCPQIARQWFQQCVLVIPNKLNMLNKELIYTAFTRSKQRLLLFIYDEKENLLVKSKGVSALLNKGNRQYLKNRKTSDWNIIREKEKSRLGQKANTSYKPFNVAVKKFEYEEELRLEKLTFPIHPDFVVKLEDGTKIYWEHLGMLDTRKYFNDWMKRRQDYTEHNLLIL